MATEIIMALVGVFCTGLSSLITFLLTKRRYNTEVDSQQIKNRSDSFEVYKKIMTEAQEALNKKVDSLQKENDTLRNQFNQLQAQMINLLMGNNLSGLQKRIFPEVTSGNTEPIDMKDM